MTPYDGWLARRTATAAAGLLALAATVVVATDEANSTAAMRAARLAAFAPGLAALAIVAIGWQTAFRGEGRALEALGASPWQGARGALAVGWTVGAAGLAVLATPVSDISALFPTVASPVEWAVAGNEFYAASMGLRIPADGMPVYEAGPGGGEPTTAAGPARGLALACVAPLVVIAPLWATLPMSRAKRALVAVVTAIGTVYLLHALAVAAWPILAAALPIVPMGGQILWKHLGQRHGFRGARAGRRLSSR